MTTEHTDSVDSAALSIGELRAQLAAREARPTITNADELKAAHLAELNDQLARLKDKATRDAAQAADAAQAVKDKAAEIKTAEKATFTFEPPQESVTARPGAGGMA